MQRGDDKMRYRIGVDVGGTFTDAVALDADSMKLVGIVKVPTTHNHPDGVSAGIQEALVKLMGKNNISPEQVVFIAHGTTQATNALLEGDVEPVAVLSAGSGFWSKRIKSETCFYKLELPAGKSIPVSSYFLKENLEDIEDVKRELLVRGIRSLVAAGAYSVDDPLLEKQICRKVKDENIYCTMTHEISSLYGLRTRTKTAILNAGIMPRMVETTELMVENVKKAGILAPLMIMRSDGGVMNAAEIKKRPVQTVLSGPAAGVAGALLYENLREGIFLEVGGTSTDISLIHNGKVMVKWAQIGNHRTYVTSLDIRTKAVAGGSLLRMENEQMVCGPRSAHIAGLTYCCYAPEGTEDGWEVRTIRASGDEADYYIIYDYKRDRKYALTLTCLSNYAGYIKEDDFSKGNVKLVKKALELLSEYLNKPVSLIVEEVFGACVRELGKAVFKLAEEYHITKEEITLIGGGGGCGAIVPMLSKRLGLPCRLCRNARAISPIGVALAMVRETYERTLSNPTEEELSHMRQEAIRRALKAGADEERIDVEIENNPQKNIVRAIASGVIAGNIKSYEMNSEVRLSREKILAGLSAREHVETLNLAEEMYNHFYYIFRFREQRKGLSGFIRKPKNLIYVVGGDGIPALRKSGGYMMKSSVERLSGDLKLFIEKYSEYGDMGEKIPDIYLIVKDKILDYSLLRSCGHIIQMAGHAVEKYERKEEIFFVCAK